MKTKPDRRSRRPTPRLPEPESRSPREPGKASGLCLIHGRQPVLEVLRLGAVRSLEISRLAHGRSIDEIRRLALAAGIPIKTVESFEEADGLTLQGVRAWADPPQARYDLRPFLANLPDVPPALIVVLDGIEDPQNFGAIIRTAEAAGVTAIIIRERRQAPITDIVAKVSAGSTYLIPIFQVVNISQALRLMREFGFWSVATVAEPDSCNYIEYNWSGKSALILGAEGAGVSDLVRRQADDRITIPMVGRTGSLNVAAAAAVLLFEAAKSRFRPSESSPVWRSPK